MTAPCFIPLRLDGTEDVEDYPADTIQYPLATLMIKDNLIQSPS